MWDATAITAVCILVFTTVLLLCPTVPVTEIMPVQEYVGRHGLDFTLEEWWMEAFIDAWLKGEERWIRHAWKEDWPETQSWNVS